MASGKKSLLRALGPEIAGPGAFDREELLTVLATGGQAQVVAALRRVAAAGERAGDQHLAEPVSGLMGHESSEVCAAAVTAIGAMGPVASRFAEDIADYLLQHPVAKCRVAALETLAKFGPGQPASVRGAVGDCLNDQDTAVRLAAVKTLAALADSQQAEAVHALLEDSSPTVRSAAIECLGQLVAVSDEVASLYPPESLGEPLLALLADGQTRLGALAAVRCLGNRAPAACIDGVVEAVCDKDCEVRQAACHALGCASRLGHLALPRLEALLRSDDAGFRAAAATAAGAIGPQAASLAEALAALLNDESADASAVPAQLGAGSRRPPAQLRLPCCAALGALGRVGAAGHVKGVASALVNENWEVRRAACEALGAYGAAAREELSAIVSVLEDGAFPVRAMACHALGQLGSAEAVSDLIERFADASHSVRLHAVMAVGQLGDKAEEYGHDVFQLLNDPVSHVRAAAVTTLWKLGRSTHPYAGIIAGMLSEGDAEVRRAAVEALGLMGRHGEAFYEEICERRDWDNNASVQEAAERTLAALSSAGLHQQQQRFAALADAGEGEGGEGEGGGGTVLYERPTFDGLGPHYADIQEKKKALQTSGKWVEGLF